MVVFASLSNNNVVLPRAFALAPSSQPAAAEEHRASDVSDGTLELSPDNGDPTAPSEPR